VSFILNKKTKLLPIPGAAILLLSMLIGLYFQAKNIAVVPQTSKTAFSPPQVLGTSTPLQVPLRGSQAAVSTQPNSNNTNPGAIDLEGVSAKAVLAYDLETGQILGGKNSGLQLPIASLTKLLTAWVVYQDGDLNDIVEIKNTDLVNVKPVLSLTPGDKIKISDLLNSMLIGSNNDAALALSNYVAEKTGQDFALLMNKAAKELGMRDSQFSNPFGFDYKGNYSTAADLQKLVNATQSLAVFTHLGRAQNFEFTSQSGRRYFTKATNRLLLKHPEIEAVKTGYTESSKGSMITKITLGGRKVILIAISSENREADTLKLEQVLSEYFTVAKKLEN